MTIISENKVVADVKRQLKHRTWMTDRKLLNIPTDGGASYLIASPYELASSETNLGQQTPIVYGLRGCKRHSDIQELRRGRVVIPDLAYTWYKYEKYPGELRRVDPLAPSGTSAYDWTAVSRAWESEYYMGSTHAQLSALTSLDKVNQRLLAKAKGEVWNAPVFFAEAKKTTDMVVSRAADLIRLARLLRSGRIDQFLGGLRTTLTGSERNSLRRAYNRDYGRGDVSKAAANAWLETTYGWTPFMMDVYQGMETLTAVQSDERNLVGTVRASVSTEAYDLNEETTYQPLIGKRWTSSTYRENRRGTWRFKPRLEAYMLGKLGLTNPLQVAWELLPFSFVADWFIPIGNYLEVLDAPLLMEHVGGAHGLRRETYSMRTYKSNDARGQGLGSWTRIDVARNPYTGMPAVGMNLLKFQSHLGAKRIASGAALLRQVLKFT